MLKQHISRNVVIPITLLNTKHLGTIFCLNLLILTSEKQQIHLTNEKERLKYCGFRLCTVRTSIFIFFCTSVLSQSKYKRLLTLVVNACVIQMKIISAGCWWWCWYIWRLTWFLEKLHANWKTAHERIIYKFSRTKWPLSVQKTIIPPVNIDYFIKQR